MSTIDEMLDAQLEEEENPICVIDKLERKINVHEACRFFGVENDKRVERIKFECPQFVGDENVDLTECRLYIIYENANGDPGLYEIKDVSAVGDNINFSWLFDEDVTKYKGDVRFIFYACKLVDGENEAVWNTTPAQGFVEEGLDFDTAIENRYPSIIETVIYNSENALALALKAKQIAENASIAASSAVGIANTANQNANASVEQAGKAYNLAEQADKKVDTLREVVSKFHSNIIEEASGAVITLADASEEELAGLTLYGKTTQDGTPTPDAPLELVSAADGGSIGVKVAGKNLFGGVYNERYPIHIPAKTPIVVSTDSGDANTYAYFFREDGTTLKYNSVLYSVTLGGKKRKYYAFTPAEDVYQVRFQTNETGNYQIELGSSPTEYEPYKEPQTINLSTPNGLPGIPVTSGGNYTDENGQQWICDEVDFARCVYVQKLIKITFNGTEKWNIGSAENGKYRFSCPSYKDIVKPFVSNDMKANILCSNFPIVTTIDTWDNITGIALDTTGRFYLCYEGVEQTTAALTAYFASNPTALIAELAAPIEAPLAAEELAAYAALHTNYPNTTILNDAGAGMQVGYVADTKLYIDKKFNELAAAIVNN